eukprot:c13899_g1_i1 orf=348-2726(+)
MRIRRQPQPNSQAVRAGNLNDGSLLSPAVVELKPSPAPQHDVKYTHASIEDLSMIYSASKFRASVNWLDRLRAAKGFPADPDLSIEQFLLLSACSSEETQSCYLEQDDVACLKEERIDGLVMAEAGCGGTDDKQERVAETFSRRTNDIPNTTFPRQALSYCSNDVAGAEACGSRSLGKRPTLASAAGINIAKPNSSSFPSLNTDKQSRNPGICSSLCQDSNTEAALSQLYFNMFADLFCMDSCSLNSLLPADAKKHQRKQEKPKVCSTFADPDPPCAVVTSSQLQTFEFDTQPAHALDSGNPTSQSEVAVEAKMDIPSSSPEVEGTENTLVQQKKTLNKKVSTDVSKKKSDMELEGSFRNELFIIDTSFPGWRTQKLFIRKGNGCRIRDKGGSVPAGGASSECTVKESKKRARTPLTSNIKNDPPKVQKEWEQGSCKEKIHKDAAKSVECPSSTEHVTRIWSTAPNTHMRSSRKRRKTTLVEEEHSKEIPEAACTKDELAEKSTTFASDHPANQPKEGLVYSIYQVFMHAGKSGLTPREAVSRILEQGLPGLHEGGVVPRVEVLKIVSNSPYFMPLEESKYILCSALVGDEDPTVGGKQNTQNSEQNDNDVGNNCSDNVKSAKQHGVSQYWAACAAIRRARTGKTRRKPSLGSYFLNTSTTHEAHEEIAILSSKKRLKSVKQDVTGLGNPCNRSDGKGWHCPLRAKVGYLLCDHHLDRLRTRVKSHIKSKMLSISKASKDERKRILSGSWMVKKVVERSRIGRPTLASFGADVQDKSTVQASEVSGSRFSQI